MTLAIYDDAHWGHRPETFFIKGVKHQNREVPERARHLLDALEAVAVQGQPAKDFGQKPIARIHTERYLDFLQNGYEQWSELDSAGREIVPNAFPVGISPGYPSSIVGRAGFHMGDMACPINAGTWKAAYGSAQAALSAVDALEQGEPQPYALCRPPGHHAFADRAAGYCFLNNAAIAAQSLLDRGAERVSILDLDVHHGNGTQDIFYSRHDVQTVSIHGDPAGFYPFFWGYEDQRGEGKGDGYTLNMPLPLGTGNAAYMEALRLVLTQIETYRPDALVVSLGLDTFKGDPYAAFKIDQAGFAEMGALVRQASIPTLTLQEGGYICPELGENLIAYLGA